MLNFALSVVALWSSGEIVVRKGVSELVPVEPLPLGGYTARQSKLMDPNGEPLWSRSVVFEQGKTKVAMISVEMLTIPESLQREVSARLQGYTVFLTATHTHSAPDSQMLNDRMTFQIPGIATYRSRLLPIYAEMIADSVRNAKRVWSGNVGEVTQATLTLNRARRKDAIPNPVATLLKAGKENLFFSYSAHGTVLDETHNQTNGDWPGVVAKELGCGVFPGAIGDVSPIGPLERFKEVPEILRSRSSQEHSLLPFATVSSKIDLGEPVAHPEFAKANKIPDVLAKNLVKKFAPSEAELRMVRFGDLAIVGVPGEPTSALGRRIEEAGKQLGFREVLVISHTGGWVGYILEADDYERGGYEATLAMHGTGLADRVIKAAELGFRKLRSGYNR